MAVSPHAEFSSMSPSDIEIKLKQIVVTTLKIPESDYNEDLTAGQHPQWDSLGHVTLLMAVEQGFNVAFDVTDALDIESVADLRDMVAKYLAAQGGGSTAG